MTREQRNERIIAQLKSTTEQGLKSKAAARAVLMETGIYTTKGNLRKEFGGRGAPSLRHRKPA